MMTNTSNDKAAKSQGIANIVIPELFLFSAYMEKEEFADSGYSPIQNQLLYTGKKDEKTTDANNLPILKTDSKGQLYHFDADEKNGFTLRAPFRGGNITGFSPLKQLDTIIPPADMVLRSVIDEGTNWLKKFNASLQQMQETIAGKADGKTESDIPTLKQCKIKKSQLRRPIDKQSDANYKQWYTSLSKDSIIYGYRLPRTRAIFFVFNLDVINKTGAMQSNIMVHIPYNKPITIDAGKIQDFSKTGSQVLYVAPLTGTDKTLPAGRYKIEVASPKSSDDIKKWNGRVAGNDSLQLDGNDSYTLSFNVKFDIQNTAGEFSIINADPISLEEALVKQYPHYYSHLMHEFLINSSGGSANTAAKKSSHALTHYFNSWNTAREISDIANKTINVKSGPQLLNLITKTLHAKFQPKENKYLRQSLDLVFQTQATIEAWNGLREKAVKLLSKLDGQDVSETMKTVTVLKNIVRKHTREEIYDAAKALREEAKNTPWFGDADSLDTEYKNSLGKAISIPPETAHFLGKVMEVADIINNGISVVDSIFSYSMAQDKLDTNKQVLDDLTHQYLEFLGKLPVTKKVNIEVNFESGKYDILPEAEEYLKNELKDKLEPYKNSKKSTITIHGYTDSVGDEKDNEILSLNRANAIKSWLVNNTILEEPQVFTKGHGENNLKVPDPQYHTDGFSRLANRRCEAEINLQVHNNGAPSRQAINTLEKSRYLTVTQHLQVVDEIVKIFESAADFTLAVLPYIVPVTSIACAAVSLAKETVKFAQTVDQATGEHLKKLTSGGEMDANLLFESLSNQILLRDLYDDSDENGNISETKLSSLQLRLRSEAIGGMLRLIIRAWAFSKNDEEFNKQIEKYKLDAYIQNFILNDGWIMPLNPPITISMDEFWLFAVNESNKVKGNPNPVAHFGLTNNNYRATKVNKPQNHYEKNYDLLINDINYNQPKSAHIENRITKIRKRNGKNSNFVLGSWYMMSMIGDMPRHKKSEFQEDYPVHYFAAGLDKFKDFARDFNPNFKGLNTDIYEHTAIYFQETNVKDNYPLEPEIETKWKLIAQNELDYYEQNKKTANNPIANSAVLFRKVDDSIDFWGKMKSAVSTIADRDGTEDRRLFSKCPISPITPVKVLIVFKNTGDKKVDRIAPVSIQLIRYDIGIDGPVYKSLARKLTLADLEDLDDLNPEQKKKIEGMYGCIINPFFQFGNLTHAGLKPGSKSKSKRDIEYDLYRGEFRDMKYGFICKVGNEDSTKIKVPFATKKYWNGPDNVDSFDDEITVTLNTENPIQKNLLQKGFLNNNTEKYDFPPFFTNSNPRYRALDAASFIRIGGDEVNNEKNIFLSPLPLRSEMDHFHKLHKSGPKLSVRGGLNIDNFNWDTPIDFVFTLSCTNPQINYYLSQNVKANHLKITGSTYLVNTDSPFSDVKGTSLNNMGMFLIGAVSIIDMPDFNIDDPAERELYISTAEQIAKNRIYKEQILKDLSLIKDLSPEQKKCYLKPKNNNRCLIYVFTKMATADTPPEIESFVGNIKTDSQDYKEYSFTVPNGTDQPPVVKHYIPYRYLKNMVHHNTTDTFYIFAASQSMSYKHPLTGDEIKSVRPFGETDGIIDEYYEYRFKKFSTIGDSSGGKPIRFGLNSLPYRFSADKAIEALKPNDRYIEALKEQDKPIDWEKKIKDWIAKDPENVNGPSKLDS